MINFCFHDPGTTYDCLTNRCPACRTTPALKAPTMHIVPLEVITLGDRQRKKIEERPVIELAEDIASIGLLHAPVCWHNGDGTYQLCAGERRLRAITRLASENRSFHHNNQEIPKGYIPITLLTETLQKPDRYKAELSENLHRVELAWADRVAALSTYHTMLVEDAITRGERQTNVDTARVVIAAQSASSPTSPQSERYVEQQVKKAVVVANHLSNPKIASARNADEAYNLVLKMQNDAFQTEIARRTHATLKSTVTEFATATHGSMFDLLPSFDAASIDLILADPPYGVNAGSGGFRARTEYHHNYTDTEDYARKCGTKILEEGFRVGKPRSNLFMFCDIKQWDWLRERALQLGWAVFPRPGIWQKSLSEGLAPWGGQGFRLTTEFFLYASKGERGLIAPPTDVFQYPRVVKAEREHAAEKPHDLLCRLIGLSTMAGDRVLDPCCGSGSTLVAAKSLRRFAHGIESDLNYFNLTMKNITAEEAPADVKVRTE